MTTIDEKQRATAEWLVSEILKATPGRDALWNLAGAVGSGKTSVLRLVADLLRSEGVVPVMITAPAGEVDAAPIALLEAATQLEAAHVLNGEMATLSDPTRHWAEKLEAVTLPLSQTGAPVVLLCDEPTRWYHRQESLFDDTPDNCARSFAEWIAKDATCRRIISGRIPDDVQPRDKTKAPRLDDGRQFLGDDRYWGESREISKCLWHSLSHAIPFRSLWEMRLCVALCHFQSTQDAASRAASDTSATALLEELLDLLEQDRSRDSVCVAIARLGVARTAVRRDTFNEMTKDLSSLDRSVIEECLCDREQGRLALHPLVRHEVVSRARDPRRWDRNVVWRLQPLEQKAVHRTLKDEYPLGNGATYRAQLESFHHDLLSGSNDLQSSDTRLRFVEQLHEIGRTLSYVHREHRRAAEIFTFALSFDRNHPYSHHYLAFNLDWLAERPGEVETHYQTAIELQSTHPWWWSRWISYLATRGRFSEARSQWREATDAMSVSEDGTPTWLFLSLHRWVARWLLHWAELDFAEQVLRSIPSGVSENDTSIQTLRDLLAALKEAETGISVFPLSIPAKDWWSPNPHTNLPLTWQDQSLRTWRPARVENVDEESGEARLVAAKRPETLDARPEYLEMTVTRQQVESSADAFQWNELHEGRFLELAYYGSSDTVRIGLHRATEWRNPHLIPLVPPPDRWYRVAVDAAWQSTRESATIGIREKEGSSVSI